MATTAFNELEVPAPQAAQRLLGAILERKIDNQIVRVQIVETEAYNQDDPASHTFKGKTLRNEIMFERAGYLYVYFIYGMHYCCNVVTGLKGYGEAVLIRAVEPLTGVDIMERNRHGQIGVNISNGPSKLCSALRIDRTLNGHYLNRSPLKLILQEEIKAEEIISGPRIGIKVGTDVMWRFRLKNNPWVSRAKN